MKLTFPWFNPVLNPNNKSHWSKKAKARSLQKTSAFWIAKESKTPKLQDTYLLNITFCPPDKRPRDLDNNLSAIKGLIDGIAIAWKVNDKQFTFKLNNGKITKNGNIIIEVQDDDN